MKVIPSFGTPRNNDGLFLSENNIYDGSTPVTVPRDGITLLTPTVMSGWVRVKTTFTTVSGTSGMELAVIATDGTSDIMIGDSYSSASPDLLDAWDVLIPFLSDLNINQFFVSFVGVPQGAVIDVEVAGVSGEF